MPKLSRGLFIALISLSTLVRLALLPLPGQFDVETFRIWTYNAATDDVTDVYGDGDGWPPEVHEVSFAGQTATVDYPPLAIYYLKIVGNAYESVFPGFTNIDALTVAIKLMAMIAGALLAVGIYLVVVRMSDPPTARMAALAYWANPAVILHGPALGYIGTVAFVPAVACIVAAEAGWTSLSGALLAMGLLTKPQAVFALPALAIALVTIADRRKHLLNALLGAAAMGTVVVLPFAVAGTLTNLVYAMVQLVTEGLLSGTAANFWWIVGYVKNLDLSAPGTIGRAHIVRVRDVLDLPFSVLGIPGGALVIELIGWGTVAALVVWAVRRAAPHRSLPILLALAALANHCYFIFAVGVHENHLVLAIPLLAMVASCQREYRWLLALVSAIILLNLYIFYGFGSGLDVEFPRAITVVDATVLLALVNIGALVWHLRLFSRLCPAPAA